jgi:hypothetical protein
VQGVDRAAKSGLVMLVLATLVACPRATPAPASDAAPPIASATEPRVTKHARRTRTGRCDVTFLVLSDTHVGFEGIAVPQQRVVRAMTDITGQPFAPPHGSPVAKPRGLVVTGDLTEEGLPDQWRRFLDVYDHLPFPLYEMVGNHDNMHDWRVWDETTTRHGGRWYSWDWDDLHLVALAEAPDDGALAWLEKDLAQYEDDVPIVVFFHRALMGPWSTANWFNDGTYPERLAAILEKRKVLGIFHGHHHARGHYVWHGIDVYKPGAVKHDGHTFTVVHAAAGLFTVAWRAVGEGTPAGEPRDQWAQQHTKEW